MHIYDILARLPLFQGMCSEELQEVVTKTKLGFSTVRKGQVIIDAGHNCRGLYFLFEGTMNVISGPQAAAYGQHAGQSEKDADAYTVTERVEAPFVIEPERVFGMRQKYVRRYVAQSPCNLLFVKKDEIVTLSSRYLVFRLNLLNRISTHVQRLSSQLWQTPHGSVRQRILTFVHSHVSTLTGPKVFHITMLRMAAEVCASRIEVSEALRQLHDEGVLVSQRGIVTVPDLSHEAFDFLR